MHSTTTQGRTAAQRQLPIWTDGAKFAPGCTNFASRNAWWKEGVWLANAVATEKRLQNVQKLFETIRAGTIQTVQQSNWLRESPTLRNAIVRKLRSTLLRIQGAKIISELSSNKPTPSTAKLQQFCAEKQWTTFAPWRGTDRVLEPPQQPGSSSNAFFNALDNTVTVFPGLLGGQFYATNVEPQAIGVLSASDARMATLGFVFAHELAHSFDSSGIFYGHDGTVQELAPRPEIAAYLRHTRCLVESFGRAGIDPYETLDENIADAFAYKTVTALMRARGANMTAFFVAQAQLWCGHEAHTDSKHAPSAARVDVAGGVVGNVRAEAMGCASPAVVTCEGL